MVDPAPRHRNPEKRTRSGEVGIVQRLRRSLLALELGTRPRVLCGYSGGADSLALLGGLVALGRVGLADVQAVHVDHGARPESHVDAQRAAAVAARLGVPTTVVRISPGDLESGSGLGMEETLRRARYLAFAEVFAATGASALALAHHQGDQAETVLLHMLRGSGIRGASGMRSFMRTEIPWWEEVEDEEDPALIPLWRPFLSESQREVRAFAGSLGLPIVEDPSNLDRAFRRNALRYDILPKLEEIMPGAVANLARFAELAADDSDELDGQAVQALVDAGVPRALDRLWLLEFPTAIQRRIVQIWFQSEVIGVELSANRIEQILAVARSRGRTREIQIRSGWSVRVSRDALCLSGPGRS